VRKRTVGGDGGGGGTVGGEWGMRKGRRNKWSWRLVTEVKFKIK